MVMVMIWIALAVTFLVGIGMDNRSYRYGDFTGHVIAVIASVILFTSLVVWPVSYYGSISNIQAYYAFKDTIEVARADMDDIERAAITQEIAAYNAWLRKSQYWNLTIFDIYIPDKVMELEPLK